jgi:hypothetical protein
MKVARHRRLQDLGAEDEKTRLDWLLPKSSCTLIGRASALTPPVKAWTDCLLATAKVCNTLLGEQRERSFNLVGTYTMGVDDRQLSYAG